MKRLLRDMGSGIIPRGCAKRIDAFVATLRRLV